MSDIIHYDYEAISQHATSSKKLVNELQDVITSLKTIVDKFPWDDPQSAANFKTTANAFAKNVNEGVSDYEGIIKSVESANSGMKDFNDSVARQWS